MPTLYSNLFQLSERELEVLALLIEGRRNREIAVTLCISERTVEHHVDNIRRKQGARNRTELVKRALTAGMIQPMQIGTSTDDRKSNP